MKLFSTLLVVFSLALICSSVSVDSARRLKKHHTHSKVWFDSFFNWRLAYFTVKNSGKQFDFEAKVNENKTGIILAEDGTYTNDNTGFIKNVLVFDGKTPIIDFRLVKGCKFNNVEVGTFEGYRFNFDASNFEGKTEGIWRVDVSYRWGAGFVGGLDIKELLIGLTNDCKVRQTDVRAKVSTFESAGDNLSKATESAAAAEQLAQTKAEVAKQQVAVSESVKSELKKAEPVKAEADKTLEKATKNLEKASASSKNSQSKQEKVAKELSDASSELDGLNVELEKLQTQHLNAVATLNQAKERVEKAKVAQKAAADALKKADQELAASEKENQDAQKAAADAEKGVNDVKSKHEKSQQNVVKLKEAEAAAKTELDQALAAEEKAKAELKDAQNLLQLASNNLEQVRNRDKAEAEKADLLKKEQVAESKKSSEASSVKVSKEADVEKARKDLVGSASQAKELADAAKNDAPKGKHRKHLTKVKNSDVINRRRHH